MQVLPAHGSGSACGKALGAIAVTTVGYERNFSWWGKYLKNNDEQGFVDELLNGQPDAHAYFARMKLQNKVGPAVIGNVQELVEFTSADLQQALADDRAIFVDTRSNQQVHEGTVARSLNIPGVAKAASYGAWVVDPDLEQRPLVLLAESREQAEEMRDHLVRVGIDTTHGFITTLEGLDLVTPKLVQPEQLDGFDRVMLLDVRNRTEYAHGHVPGAVQLSGGRVMWYLDQLPEPGAGTIVTYCQSGVRNSVAASALRRAGYDIAELDGSYAGWASRAGNVPVLEAA